MGDTIIIFKSFDNPISANIVKSKLESYGIACFLTDEYTIGLNPIYNQALGGVKLQIFEKDFQIAMEILQEEIPVIENEIDNDIICPNCKSKNVSFGTATRKKSGVLTIMLWFVSLVYPSKIKKVYHCNNCQHEFKP